MGMDGGCESQKKKNVIEELIKNGRSLGLNTVG